MKPPPRQRLKPKRYAGLHWIHEQQPKNIFCDWTRIEQQRFLRALETLKTDEVDYAFLKRSVPERPISQICTVVETLKAKAVRTVIHKLLWQRRAEKRMETPVELWRDMAAIITGELEEPISTAFSQMLKVSSTEPRCLRNSVHPPTSSGGLKAPTIRPGPTQPSKTVPVTPGKLPPNTASNVAPASPILKAAPTLGPVLGPPPPPTSPVIRVAGASVAPVQQTSSAPVTVSATTSASQNVPVAGVAGVDGAVTRTTADVSQESVEGTGDEGSNWTVDFQKIYLYLDAVNKDNQQCTLTSMESAVVLDLLMCLPEELPLLDYNKLHHHMKEIYSSLSAPAHSKMGREMIEDPKTAQSMGKDANDPLAPSCVSAELPHTVTPEPVQGDSSVTDDTASTTPATSGSGARALPVRLHTAEDSTHAKSQTLRQLSERGPCPLNPFMIPLNLLVKKK